MDVVERGEPQQEGQRDGLADVVYGVWCEARVVQVRLVPVGHEGAEGGDERGHGQEDAACGDGHDENEQLSCTFSFGQIMPVFDESEKNI